MPVLPSVESGLRGSGRDACYRKRKKMNHSSSRAGIAALAPLALASALSTLVFAPAAAQSGSGKTLAPVVVTASRFANDPAFNPIGATVITSDEIREAGIGNVNEAIRKIGGVYGRQGFSGTSDFSLDLRGFGTASDQNLVVLVDGVRISENELSPALLSSIPVESVERIEIMRGGSSVLYGEGATGGTIQIITKRGRPNSFRGTVAAEVGSYDRRELRTSLAKGWDAFSMDANVSTLRADNYRDNNAVKQDNFNGGFQWASKEGRVGMRIDVARQDSRFPGALTLAQAEANPRQTLTPNDFGSFDVDRYTLFGERRLGDFELAAELSSGEKTARAALGTFRSKSDARTTQFSPRVRHLSSFGTGKNELVVGMDFARWTRLTDSAFSKADASQKSQAIYARDEVRIGNARIAAGARHETFDKDFKDPVTFGAYGKKHNLNAWELQGSYALMPAVQLFAKAGRSYRVANADENGFTPMPNQPLEPQISRDLELGTTLGNVEKKLTVRVFQHRLTNEILYDPTRFANVNLDPTRRRGVEVEASTRLGAAFTLSANLQHISAEFTGGPNAGKEVVLVPQNIGLLRLNWLPGNGQSAYAGVQWVDSQRYGGDFSNTCVSRIPSYATLDARYARRVGAWEFAVAGSNLTDKDYFSNAFGACRSGIYPDAGRQLKLTARYDF
jgi:iron complex outermembrane receptor protein